MRRGVRIFKNKQRLPLESLSRPDSIVEFSCYSQNSITSLDLSRNEITKFKAEIRMSKLGIGRFLDPTFQILSDKYYKDTYVATEEACRKRLAPNRSVLYKFHLDVSKELEISLRNDKRRRLRECFSEHILLNRVTVCERDVYHKFLKITLEKALDSCYHKLKLVTQICKLAKTWTFISESERIRDTSLALLCFQRADPAVVKDFFSVMNFGSDHFFNYSVDIFEFVLYHANRNGCDLWGNPPTQDPIHASISYRMFVKTESLLIHYNAPKFCEVMYQYFRDGLRRSVRGDISVLEDENELITRERHLLILELFHIFWIEPKNGLKAMQLVWRSLSDPYINLDELKLTLAGIPNPAIITKFCNFIKDVTGEEVLEETGHRPRKLKHYCRTLIRGILSNNRLLAAGISELKLPPSLKSYLKLES